MKHLNLQLERLEQRIAPGGCCCGSHKSSKSHSHKSSGGSKSSGSKSSGSKSGGSK
jgi:hypothetical protein